MMIRNKHQLDEHTMHSVHTQHTTWSTVVMAYGEQCVMTIGTEMMPWWYADS